MKKVNPIRVVAEVYFTNVTLKDKEEKLQNVYKSHDFMRYNMTL